MRDSEVYSTWRSQRSQRSDAPPLPRFSFARHRSWISEPGGYRNGRWQNKLMEKFDFKKEEVALAVGDGEVSLLDVLEERTSGQFALSQLKQFAAGSRADVAKNWMVAIQFCLDFLEYRRSFLKLSSEEQNLSPPPFFIIEELMRNRDTRATALSIGATSGITVAPSLFFPPIPTGRLNDSLPPTPHTQGTDLVYAKSPPPRQSVIETNRTETLQKLGHHGRSLTWKEPPIASLLSSTPARQPTVRHTNYSMFRFSTATTLPDCVNPSSQPLRQQLHRLLAKYLGADSSALQLLSLPKRCVSQAFLEARYTTSPDVLHPIFSNLLDYLSETLLPAFIRDAKSKPSQKPIPFNIVFRVVIGILATMAACALDVLLSLDPSPLSNTRIPRPFRLFALPLLALAVGCAIPAHYWTALRTVELARPSMFRHRRGGWGRQKEWLDLDKIGAVEQERKRERVRAWMTIALFIGSICALQGIVVALPFVELS